MVRMHVLRVLGVLGCAAALAEAQVRAGSQFQVNTEVTGHQIVPALSVAGDGSFLVAWHRFGGGYVSARRFDVRGAPLGAEFQVGTSPEVYGFPNASVAGDAQGRFVVTWTGDDGSYGGIFGRRYDRSGLPLGTTFQANAFTTRTQSTSSVAVAADGAFVVTWADSGFPNGPVRGAFAQRYDSRGVAQGANFQVDDIGSGPVIAVAARGDFVVAWGDFGGVFARRFDAAGAPLGAVFLVSAATANSAQEPAIAVDGDGNFVVAWYEVNVFPDFDVRARRFGADGAPRGADFRVNLHTPVEQVRASVAMDAIGNFVVAWQSQGQDQSGWGVLGRRFRADGTPRGGEFLVPTTTAGNQVDAAVASDRHGNLVVAWYGDSDGSGYGIFGQRFGGIRAASLAIDAGGNGVLEPGESVVVSPSWRNVNGTAQAFGGAGLSFSGPGTPGNPTYTLADAAAAYGTVADGATASCASAGDCYAVQISVPSARPVLHWDARLREEITPSGFGQTQGWAVHVGGSFTDVPSSQPFYRFVETLLHTGITGGCGPQAYCPDAAAARQAMAVFVLVAREGPAYLPPACTVPVFGDVPAASPFCRWIEELARRNVVGGCGGGNFCPSQPVTREQMAIFALRTLDPALDPPACTPPNLFDDVPETSPYCRWIEELARRGVVTGCGGQNYCPGQAVTRGEMAVFITATFGLALYGV